MEGRRSLGRRPVGRLASAFSAFGDLGFGLLAQVLIEGNPPEAFMTAARIEHYMTRIADTKTVEALDAIIRELEERQSAAPDDVVPQYVIGMARMERLLSFGVPL